jgi:hypothetical protein
VSLFCVEALEFIRAPTELEEIVLVPWLHAEFIGQGLFWEQRVTRKLQGTDSSGLLRCTRNNASLGRPSQAQFVIEFKSIVVFIVFDSTGGESPGEIVFKNPGLVPALDKIHRVNHSKVSSNVLADGEASSRVFLGGDQAGLDPHVA